MNSPLNSWAPPVPQAPPDWILVTLETEYTYDNSVTVSWYGRPSTGASSPFNPLYNWTKSGSISGGIYNGNPGNATIIAVPWDNTTTALEVRDFLNYSMENYIRYESWPALSTFNFTAYENQTLWEFNDRIASHEEFLNTTFFLVNNATSFLMNGFNASGIIASLTDYHIHLEWFEADPVAEVNFTYTVSNVIEERGGTSIFRLGKAMGNQAPLNLTGTGTLRINGPYNRVILNGTPIDIFENTTFPYYPIGVEEYNFDEFVREFDYTVWFNEGTSTMSVTRDFSTNSLNRGELLTVRITIRNTGNTPFSEVTISDIQAITTGMFQLVSGTASATVTNLHPGENVTLEYTSMALISGIFDYPSVEIVGIDLFANQYVFVSSTEPITIGSGLTPSELLVIEITIVAIIIVIIIIILYRFRRRIF